MKVQVLTVVMPCQLVKNYWCLGQQYLQNVSNYLPADTAITTHKTDSVLKFYFWFIQCTDSCI